MSRTSFALHSKCRAQTPSFCPPLLTNEFPQIPEDIIFQYAATLHPTQLEIAVTSVSWSNKFVKYKVQPHVVISPLEQHIPIGSLVPARAISHSYLSVACG